MSTTTYGFIDLYSVRSLNMKGRMVCSVRFFVVTGIIAKQVIQGVAGGFGISSKDLKL